jgi:hypothetical protein
LISEGNEKSSVAIIEKVKQYRALEAAKEYLQRQECELPQREEDANLRKEL